MAIGGYETPVVYGHTQIFDPTMAAMVLDVNKRYGEALKAEYERGLKDFEDFSTKYGDFISPFSKDMERYGEMMGNIKLVIDQAYANGIDLTRSPEGRLLISRMTHSIDPGEYNNMRANAKLGYEYLDAIEKAKAKNEFNQAFEDWTLLKENGGPGSFSDFSSAGGATWNRPAPYVYQDLNQFTGHIFDKMEDSFLGTGADHYDYYGVSREDRLKALTQHLSGLLSSSLGQYHYQNSKAAYERILGRPLSDSEAMAYWLNDILDSTQEYEHRNRKLNEMWKLQYEDSSRQRAAIAGRVSNSSMLPLQSIAELIRTTSSTRITGQQTQEYGPETLAKLRDIQIKNGLDISKATGGHSNTYKGRLMFKDIYQDSNYSAAALTDFVVNQGFLRCEDIPNSVIVPVHQLNRLANLGDIVSKTTGYRGANFDSKPFLRSKLKNAETVVVTFTGGDYGAYMKDATNLNHFECIVSVGKKKYQNDDPSTGKYQIEYTQVPFKESIYFDSHITSQPDDPRAGYLGTKGKDGKIKETKGIRITNSQDTKYQDAVAADVKTTADYVKGSNYGFDATYTELTGYPYQTRR